MIIFFALVLALAHYWSRRSSRHWLLSWLLLPPLLAGLGWLLLSRDFDELYRYWLLLLSYTLLLMVAVGHRRLRGHSLWSLLWEPVYLISPANEAAYQRRQRAARSPAWVRVMLNHMSLLSLTFIVLLLWTLWSNAESPRLQDISTGFISLWALLMWPLPLLLAQLLRWGNSRHYLIALVLLPPLVGLVAARLLNPALGLFWALSTLSALLLAQQYFLDGNGRPAEHWHWDLAWRQPWPLRWRNQPVSLNL